MANNPDPTPKQIHEHCLRIQATWTPAEKLKRLRSDLRPTLMRSDGIRQEIDSEIYEGHHSERERLLAAVGDG